MNLQIKILVCLGALLAVAATTNALKRYEYSRAKVTALVVDEAGKPVVGAKVSCSFCEAYDANKVVRSEGLTDSEGKFVAEGFCGGVYGASLKMDGFYFSGLNAPRFSGIVDGKWQPWNSTAETILRRIGNPVALYAKSAWLSIPVIGEPCGYDLEKGDWVAPYGKGIVSDFILKLERRYVSRDDFDVSVELSFSKPLDGIKQIQWPESGRCSIFKWPRNADEAGYEAILKSSLVSAGNNYKASITRKEGYFFRVRTVEQNGKIVSAHYGKIKGGLELAPSNSKTCRVKLTYYFNPTPLDRNLEWDTTKNLLGGLSWEESPRDP